MEEDNILGQYNLPHEAEMRRAQQNILEEYNRPHREKLRYYQGNLLVQYSRNQQVSWNIPSYRATLNNTVQERNGNYYGKDGALLCRIGEGSNRVFIEDNHGSIYISPLGLLFTELQITNEELNLRASLSTLKRTEAGRSNSQLGYNAWNENYVFTKDSYAVNPGAYSKHPGEHPVSKRTTAGAYQFLERVFKDLFGEQEFSPINQDKAVIKNMTRASYNAALSGDVSLFKTTTSARWTSLKEWNNSKLQKLFQEYRANELRGESDLAAPVGTLLKK